MSAALAIGDGPLDKGKAEPRPEHALRVQLLGSLQLFAGDINVTPSAPKVRQVLASLVLRRNELVTSDELIDELWDVRPPASAVPTLQTYIYRQRRALRDCDGFALTTFGNGYRLEMGVQEVDAFVFRDLVAAASRRQVDNQVEAASSAYAQALSLWRGPALNDVSHGTLLRPYVVGLEEDYVHALEKKFECDVSLGRQVDMLSDLRAAAARFPTNDRLRSLLGKALLKSGRKLEASTELKRAVVDYETGLGLGAPDSLITLKEEAEAASSGATLYTSESAPSLSPLDEPASTPDTPDTYFNQIPPIFTDIVGHDKELETSADFLMESLTTRPKRPPTLHSTGLPGHGKTLFARALAETLMGEFTSGAIYLSLPPRPSPDLVAQALASVLVKVDVEVDAGDVSSVLAAYRTVTSDLSLLVVADGVHDKRTLQMVAPSGAESALISTGNYWISGLKRSRTVVPGALVPTDAMRLVREAAGGEQLSQEDQYRVARLCYGVPQVISRATAEIDSLLNARQMGQLEAVTEEIVVRFMSDDREELVRHVENVAFGSATTARSLLALSTQGSGWHPIVDVAERIGSTAGRLSAALRPSLEGNLAQQKPGGQGPLMRVPDVVRHILTRI